MKDHTLLVATKNIGKYTEVISLLQELPLQILSLKELKNSRLAKLEVKETGESFAENAIIKAKTWGQLTGHLTLADDSGLIVDALNGRPGIHSKRYGPTDKERIKKLLIDMEGVPQKQRTARFISTVAIFDPENSNIRVVEGVAEGRITSEPKGESGFGYDPVFFSFDLKQTFAQAGVDEKNKVSHRARALQKAKKILGEIPIP